MELRVIQGRKQIVADHLRTAYLRLGDAVSELRTVTMLHSMRQANREAYGRAGMALSEAEGLLRELQDDLADPLPRLPDGTELAGKTGILTIYEKAMAIDDIQGLLAARAQLAPVLAEAGRDAGATVPDDLPDGSFFEGLFRHVSARLIFGVALAAPLVGGLGTCALSVVLGVLGSL